jgi:hypothetical protein
MVSAMQNVNDEVEKMMFWQQCNEAQNFQDWCSTDTGMENFAP